MIYSNPEFFLLFILTLVPSVLIPDKKIRFYLLLAMSLAFYSWAGIFDTLVFLFVVFMSWLSAWSACKFPSKKRFFLTIGIVIMVVHLFFWKYFPWVSGEIQSQFPAFIGGKKVSFPLPVGISFFTLQGIAYLVDLTRGEAEFIGLSRYFLFKSFFPQLVAGPIVRVHQLLPQLIQLRRPSVDDLGAGLSLFCLGFFKKIVIADRCAPFVDFVFAKPGNYDRSALLLAALGYAVQIWADFSGYTDMGRGCARMLGIQLPQNFLSPYFARSPSEFWRRWHITLGEWIRDYIYIPLGGSAGGKLRVTCVALLTMVISGLWHGANWTFLIWGLYHGGLLVFERRYKALNVRAAPAALSIFMMFLATVFGWVIFRVQKISDLGLFVSGVFSSPGNARWVAPQFGTNIYIGAIFCCAIQAFFYYDLKGRSSPVLVRLNRSVQFVARSQAGGALCGALMAGLVVGCIVLRFTAQSKSFIYFKF